MTDKELIARLREAVNGEHDMTPHGADCLQAADRIEALTAKVKLMDDLDVINGEKIEALTAKNEMLGREVNIARYGQPDFAWSVHVEVMTDLNAKLAKAVEGLREIAGFAEKEWVTPSGEAPPDVQNLCDIARALLAEIEGTDAP
jgi:hypothetical protein